MLRKEVVVETRLVKVQVRREQLVVEHHPVGPGVAAGPDPVGDEPEPVPTAGSQALRRGETIRLQLVEDEVVIQTRPVVYRRW